MTDHLSANYKLVCSEPDCEGQAIVEQNTGVAWVVGQRIPMDSTRPSFARCPLCLRHDMTVASAPPPPAKPKPKGFTKVPTE